jgi:cytochrome c oxidase subunit 3
MSATADIEHPPRPTRLASHFDSMQQQHDAAKLGMWLFLITEILLFSGLFLAYTVYRWRHPEVFNNASDMLNLAMGATNTVVLITSSLTMALAVRAAQLGQQRNLIVQLTFTLLFAGAFMVIKYFEYTAKFDHGIFPGRWFHPHAEYVEIFTHQFGDLVYARTFFSIYFMMTGLHGFHVLIGMFLIGWLLVRAILNHFNGEYYTPVEVIGLYWHIVDMIWIFLFPLLYLVDRSGFHG